MQGTYSLFDPFCMLSKTLSVTHQKIVCIHCSILHIIQDIICYAIHYLLSNTKIVCIFIVPFCILSKTLSVMQDIICYPTKKLCAYSLFHFAYYPRHYLLCKTLSVIQQKNCVHIHCSILHVMQHWRDLGSRHLYPLPSLFCNFLSS